MPSQRKLSAATIAALAVVGGSLLGIWLARPLEALLEIAETEAGTTWLRQLFSTLAVLAGAQLVNRLIDALIWDRLVSRALGGKVPAILKTMVSLVVFLIGISIIVGVVFDRSVAGFLAALPAAWFSASPCGGFSPISSPDWRSIATATSSSAIGCKCPPPLLP